jgi:hypothetical protein
MSATLTAGSSKTLRKLAILCLSTLLLVPVVIVAFPVSVLFIATGGAAHSLGGPCSGANPQVKPGASIDGYGSDQLGIAATIITVGQSRGIDAHGQQIAVMVAMGESSLRNLDHGDAVDNSTIGVFQQGASYGTRAQRMDVATAAAAFYTRMVAVPGWETRDPSTLAHTVQINADPNHYTPFFDPAGDVVTTLTGATSSACQIPADAQAAAAVLVEAIRTGKLTFLEDRYEQQVLNIADGSATAQCELDVHVLQIMVIAVNNFQQVGVSDLNRRCTGSTPGAGTASAHWQGKAVDFYALNRRSLQGSDDLSIQLIRILDPYVPHGSALGQSTCRTQAGTTLTGLKNFTTQFYDTCDHQHIQVP